MILEGTNLKVYKNRTTKQIWTNAFDGTWRTSRTYDEERAVTWLYRFMWKDLSITAKYEGCKSIINRCPEFIYGKTLFVEQIINDDLETEEKSTSKIDLNTIVKQSIQALINFFSEFNFEPNFRFVNTFARFCYKSKMDAKSYVNRYFELTDNPYAPSISEKMKSQEFEEICKTFKEIEPAKQINKRFKLYYGSQGTGKTTAALEETEGRCMVCHSAMLPNDLMEDFKFVDGKAEFTPSALQIAMTEGHSITLDEINLLPFESLRFLQSILDGKMEIIYKGKTIEIHDGFKIIGTMNLTVNGSTYSLPEPLVDRCEDIRKYQLTAENLMSAIL